MENIITQLNSDVVELLWSLTAAAVGIITVKFGKWALDKIFDFMYGKD